MGKRKQAHPKLKDMLRNWNVLNKHLMELTELQVGLLLAHEREYGKRVTFLLRLHARMGVLRRTRERVALVHKAGKNTALIPGEKYK